MVIIETEDKDNYIASNNKDFINLNSIKLRLDTDDLLDRIEHYLKGYREVYTSNDTGDTILKKVNTGYPKCNSRGVQGIMGRITLLINPQVVQGNWKEERFENSLYKIRKSLAQDMMINLLNWEIDENDYMGIIDSIMDTLEAYLSRLIDNKERESYATTIRSHESNTTKDKSGFFK